MTYLLDTHILIWLITNDNQLKDSIKDVLFNQANEFFVNHESLREIVIKAQLKRPDFQLLNGITITDIGEVLQQKLGIRLLPSKISHLQQLEELITIHKDPFDHLLICQAIVEKMILISRDGNFPFYQSQGLKLLIA